TAGSQEGNQARPPVRARQEERASAGTLREARRGDRGADGAEGARTVGRVENAFADVHAGHLVGTPRRTALRHLSIEGPHARPAVQRGEEAQHRGPLADEKVAAPARGRPQEVLTGLSRRGAAVV